MTSDPADPEANTPLWKLPRGLRHKTLFKDASVTLADRTDIQMPANIAFAKGSTRAAQYDDAIQTIRHNSGINAVIVIEKPQSSLQKALTELYHFAAGKRLRTKASAEIFASPAVLQQHIKSYLRARFREASICQDELISNDNLTPLTQVWGDSVADCNTLQQARVVDSILAYVPHYKNKEHEKAHLNTHIDHVEGNISDIRIVECVEGSGTVLFNDGDFEIPTTLKDLQSGLMHQKSARVQCWALATGSSVVMRQASYAALKDGGRPCIHAHGIGISGEYEQRLVLRHDLRFT